MVTSPTPVLAAVFTVSPPAAVRLPVWVMTPALPPVRLIAPPLTTCAAPIMRLPVASLNTTLPVPALEPLTVKPPAFVLATCTLPEVAFTNVTMSAVLSIAFAAPMPVAADRLSVPATTLLNVAAPR